MRRGTTRPKAKGSAFERKICSQLSLWVTDGKRDDCFWRSAMSGGRATVRRRAGLKSKHVSGDVCAVHEAGNRLMEFVFFECKTYSILHLDRIFRGTGNLMGFWKIAKEQAQLNSKYPFLVAKQNMYPPILCLDLATVRMLQLQDLLLLSAHKYDLHVTLWDDFLSTLRYEEVVKAFRPALYTKAQISLPERERPVLGRRRE